MDANCEAENETKTEVSSDITVRIQAIVNSALFVWLMFISLSFWPFEFSSGTMLFQETDGWSDRLASMIFLVTFFIAVDKESNSATAPALLSVSVPDSTLPPTSCRRTTYIYVGVASREKNAENHERLKS